MVRLANPPRKPFIARGSNIVRCDGCLLDKQNCICDVRKAVTAKVEFCLLSHPYELYKPTNTGRLIVDCIKQSKVFHWHRTEPDPEFLALINNPSIDPYIVFPEEADYQHRMTDFSEKTDKQAVFIILDGTWRQARRMFRLSRYMDHLPVISLKTQRQSRYKLRKAASDQHLCTVEVAAALLEQVGDVSSAHHLDSYFDLFNERYMQTRRF